ncbi:hypothetical protein AFERRID_25890 [Acidithiobacillus ferridurans]|jgi:hypothetical protein|uniref:Uncharacterized protein n=1 Tax=Acidithiobacillus ferridurans TaxID=1232575 RepID=A0A2Z6IKM7_ACIFI|nr:hypothetical protein AFERRID_25890 [Acidithiobacillus ferridurans]
MLSQFSIDEASNHCAVDLLGNGWVCAKLDGKGHDFRNDPFNPLGCLDVGGGFLELCRLFYISPTLCQ